jgi:methionyl-tRNA formyltransferase
MNILYFGSGAFGLPALEAVAQSRHKIVGVISQPDRPAGRGNKLEPTPVSKWATEHAVPLLRVEDANSPESLTRIAAFQADCFLVIAFGQKLSDILLDLAPRGSINLHSSLLPKYRGAAPINWALINNDAETGVTVLRVTNVMDGGDILDSATTAIGPAETAGELHDRLALLGAPLVERTIDAIENGTEQGIAQDATRRSAAPKLSRAMAWIDFSQDAPRVSARIRGLSPWPACGIQLIDSTGSLRVQAAILKCQTKDAHSTHAATDHGRVLPDRSIACGHGSIELLTLQPVGKKAMDAKAFANGYGLEPGARLASIVPPPAR